MNNILTWIGKQFVITSLILYLIWSYIPSLLPSFNLGCGYGTGYSRTSYYPTSYKGRGTVTVEPLGGIEE